MKHKLVNIERYAKVYEGANSKPQKRYRYTGNCLYCGKEFDFNEKSMKRINNQVCGVDRNLQQWVRISESDRAFLDVQYKKEGFISRSDYLYDLLKKFIENYWSEEVDWTTGGFGRPIYIMVDQGVIDDLTKFIDMNAPDRGWPVAQIIAHIIKGARENVDNRSNGKTKRRVSEGA